MTLASRECANDSCRISCDKVFERLNCFPRIRGGSRIEWVLHPEFQDPRPHLFQLEVGEAAVEDPAAWTPATEEATEDAWFLTDPAERIFGTQQWTHYRVRLQTPRGVYYSTPVPCLGVLDRRQWRILQAILRAERKNFVWGGGQDGYLFKRKTSGQKCSCLDPLTDEVRDAQCKICQGVGYVGGYYAAVSCVWAILSEQPRHAKFAEGASGQGMVDNIRISARMLAIPQVYEQDVWVDKNTDTRYFIHSFRSLCDVRGIPAVNEVELRQIPFSHHVYSLPITDQIPLD